MAVEKNVTKPFLARYVREMGMEKVARGVYITDDVWSDELFIMQVRSSAVIFSGETALFLHGLLDGEYSKIKGNISSDAKWEQLDFDEVSEQMDIANLPSPEADVEDWKGKILIWMW